MPLRCPSCTLLSPANAIRCDCGHEFSAAARADVSSMAAFQRRDWTTVTLFILSMTLDGVTRAADGVEMSARLGAAVGSTLVRSLVAAVLAALISLIPRSPYSMEERQDYAQRFRSNWHLVWGVLLAVAALPKILDWLGSYSPDR